MMSSECSENPKKEEETDSECEFDGDYQRSDVEDDGENRLAIARRCLEQKVSEIELLQSMYASSERLQFIGFGLNDLKKCAEDVTKISEYEKLLRPEFSLTLSIPSEFGCVSKAEITFQTPLLYPELSLPTVFVRSENLSREKSCKLNQGLRKFMICLNAGEPCALQIIQWVQENFQNYSGPKSPTFQQQQQQPDKSMLAKAEQKFSRLWIYSHHIYSTIKRRNLVSLAGELDLSGFSLPGKPGVICVEGLAKDCDEYWEMIHCWSWKKIVIRHREDTEISEKKESLESLRKFQSFKEESFRVRRGHGREYHVDMGLFNDYLIQHNCTEMFEILFGLQGKHN